MAEVRFRETGFPLPETTFVTRTDWSYSGGNAVCRSGKTESEYRNLKNRSTNQNDPFPGRQLPRSGCAESGLSGGQE